MKLLAIDTSTDRASIALMINEEITCKEQGSQKTHAQLLLPMIDSLLTDADLRINQLDAIVFGCGPGSFTGLRIACSIAKGLAHAHDLSLIPVSSLGAIAWSAREQINHQSSVLAVLDARMREMYWSYFTENHYVAKEQVNAVQDISLSTAEPLVLAGVGIAEYWDEVPDAIKALITHRIDVFPNAAAMIRLAQHAMIAPVSVTQAQPVYVRNQVTQGDSRG